MIVGIEYFNVFQELSYKLFGFGFVVIVSFVCCVLCCQIGIMCVI